VIRGRRREPSADKRTLREPEAMIQADHLTKRFGRVVAVEDLNLRIARGEIFGLIGPDGAGKTTAIRLLAAIMVPTKGRATVGGFDTVRQAEKTRRLIGYMPQRFSLYGDLSVIENLSFFADIFSVRGRERRERIDQLLHFARLTEFRKRRADHLSGGMQKKLALACTLIHKPQVLFLDEPTTGVDPISRRDFWNILSDLHLEGVTLLVSTPYMDEAERCSRVGLMFEGRLMLSGRPDQLKRSVSGDMLALSTPQLSQARELLVALPGVLEVQIYGDLLHIFVDAADERQQDIADRLAEAQIQIVELRRSRPRMEEAFVSLIRRRQEEG